MTAWEGESPFPWDLVRHRVGRSGEMIRALTAWVEENRPGEVISAHKIAPDGHPAPGGHPNCRAARGSLGAALSMCARDTWARYVASEGDPTVAGLWRTSEVGKGKGNYRYSVGRPANAYPPGSSKQPRSDIEPAPEPEPEPAVDLVDSVALDKTISGRPCMTCVHDEVETIDELLRVGTMPLREIEQRFGVSSSSLHRHRHSHLDQGVPPYRRPKGEIRDWIGEDRVVIRRDGVSDVYRREGSPS